MWDTKDCPRSRTESGDNNGCERGFSILNVEGESQGAFQADCHPEQARGDKVAGSAGWKQSGPEGAAWPGLRAAQGGRSAVGSGQHQLPTCTLRGWLGGEAGMLAESGTGREGTLPVASTQCHRAAVVQRL